MILWTIIIIASVLLDQLSKWIVVRTMPLYDTIPLIDGFFSLTHIRNKGAAWGMFSDSRWVFIIATAIALIVLPLLLYRYRKLHFMFGLPLSLIIGGAAGNMIDRVFLGYVVDFMEFTFIDFPVFNVADVFIVVGTVMMMVYILFIDRELFTDKKNKDDAEDRYDGADNDTV
ncbi:MAG: signal peptidase II [Clostridia bacterium]|nr:signal peptidase II [Clostridia bacterium]